jgi:hypothetical protein
VHGPIEAELGDVDSDREHRGTFREQRTRALGYGLRRGPWQLSELRCRKGSATRAC